MRPGWNIFSTISAIAAGWLGLSMVVLALTDAAPGAMVVLPSKTLMNDLPDGVAITEISGLTVTFARAEPGLTAALYQRGAWLVLPAGLTGCLPPPGTQPRAAGLSHNGQSPT